MPLNSNGKQQLFNSAATQKKAELEMSLHQRWQMRPCLSILQKHTEAGRAKCRSGVEVNPAANVKTVARLKSMGDGGSSQIGSVMAVVTQRRGVGSLLYAKASGASRRPYR